MRGLCAVACKPHPTSPPRRLALRPKSLSLRALLASGIVVALAVLVCVPHANAQTKKKPAPAKKATAPAGDPPGTNIIMGNLRTWYKKYANSDGVWGKTEVARAFGYLHAYDWVPADQLAKEKEADAASGVTDPDSIKSAGAEREKKRNYWRKDKKFMDALDLDTDEIINKDEFEALGARLRR